MLNFFDTLIEYIQILFNFVVTMITGLINAFTTLFNAIGNVITVAGYVPYFITSSIFISLFVVVINYLIGRSNQ